MISHVLFSANEVITQPYSSQHQAIDIVGAGNTISDVIAYDDGIVVLVESGMTRTDTNSSGTASYGNFVKIKHGNNIQTLYAHLKYGSVRVKKGDHVQKGQVIGTMGATGRAFGVHLHFEVRDYNNKRKNPYDYLWQTDKSPTLTNIVTPVSTEKKEEPVVPSENQNTEVEDTQAEIVQEVPEKDITDDKLTEEVIDNDYTLFENKEYKYMSLSDALNEIYVNNTYEYRYKLALKNGIENYTGTNIQNLNLLKKLKDGTLKAAY